MLVLTTRVDTDEDDIVIELPDGREIEIVALGAKGVQVKLGIQADKDVKINRRRIAEKIKRESKVDAVDHSTRGSDYY